MKKVYVNLCIFIKDIPNLILEEKIEISLINSKGLESLMIFDNEQSCKEFCSNNEDIFEANTLEIRRLFFLKNSNFKYLIYAKNRQDAFRKLPFSIRKKLYHLFFPQVALAS